MNSKNLSKLNSFINGLLKIFFTILIIFLIFWLYYLVINFNQSISILSIIIIIFVIYWVILYYLVNLMGLFNKYNEIKYIPLFSSFIPIFFIFLRIYQTREFIVNDFVLIIFSYTIVSISTYKILQASSSQIISQIIGKKISDLGNNFFITTIIFNNYSYEIRQLIKVTITNILKYKVVAITDINFNNQKYKIFHYRRKYEFNNWYNEDILLVELFIETDPILDEIDEYDYIEDYEILDEKNSNDEFTYTFVFLYQFFDVGKTLIHTQSDDTELGLILKSLLPKDTLIYQYSKLDVTPPEIIKSLYGAFEKYLTIKYGMMLEVIYVRIRNEIQQMKESHKKILKYISYSGIYLTILLLIFNYLNSINLNQSSTNALLIIFALITATPSFFSIYRVIGNIISTENNDTQTKRKDDKS